MKFEQKLNTIINKNNSLLCVGLDPMMERIPAHIKNQEYPLFAFNKAIIDATYDLVCSFKPNSAFYEQFGASGIDQLKMTFDYIHEHHPEIVTILDAKRADIGNTNHGYATFAFQYLNADGITLHPYFGGEALKPFIDWEDKGCIIMCRNSNVDSGEFQNMMIDGKELYRYIAEHFSTRWNYNRNILLVVGATYPEELAEVRRIVGDMTMLVPGVGAQGGDVERTMRAGLNSNRAGLIINSSRAIIYAGGDEDFANRAREEAIKLRDELNRYRIEA